MWILFPLFQQHNSSSSTQGQPPQKRLRVIIPTTTTNASMVTNEFQVLVLPWQPPNPHLCNYGNCVVVCKVLYTHILVYQFSVFPFLQWFWTHSSAIPFLHWDILPIYAWLFLNKYNIVKGLYDSFLRASYSAGVP